MNQQEQLHLSGALRQQAVASAAASIVSNVNTAADVTHRPAAAAP